MVSSSGGQKPFMEPEGTSFNCCRVLAQDVGLVGIKLFVDGEQVMESCPLATWCPGVQVAASAGPVLADRVFGTSVVSRITLASSMAEMVN